MYQKLYILVWVENNMVLEVSLFTPVDEVVPRKVTIDEMIERIETYCTFRAIVEFTQENAERIDLALKKTYNFS